MTMEAGVVLDNNLEPLHWHLPPGRSVGGLPDSRDLWDVIWENRDNISGIAHSHPGSGKPGPSHTDVTTFAAIEAALGRRLDWWIVSADDEGLVLLRWAGGGKHDYREPLDVRSAWAALNHEDPKWIAQLCEASRTVGTKVTGGWPQVTQEVTHSAAGDTARLDVDYKIKM